MLQDADGHTALIWAADKGYADIVRTLLGVKSIDTNIQSEEGFTALICAAGQGYLDIVRDLLDNGETDAFLVDSCGFWAISAAANGNHSAIVKLLSNHMFLGKPKNLPHPQLTLYIKFEPTLLEKMQMCMCTGYHNGSQSSTGHILTHPCTCVP